MARPFMTFMRRLFTHAINEQPAQNQPDKKQHLQVTGEEQDKLDKQRADWEGMTPNNNP